MPPKEETLAGLLHDQGHGTRKECIALVRHGLVEVGYPGPGGLDFKPATDPSETVEKAGLHLKVRGHALPYLETLHLAMHKPAGYECSHASSHHPSVFGLLPEPWVRRGLQAVGRLDADTTGLLLLSDSGAFNHFFTSPKRHVPKTYQVQTRHPITTEQVERLTAGVVLRDEKEPTLPASIRLLGERTCEMTLEEGRYHQVKRMFAAVSNRVEGIHRVAIGGFRLEDSLLAGAWRTLTSAELELLGYREP